MTRSPSLCARPADTQATNIPQQDDLTRSTAARVVENIRRRDQERPSARWLPQGRSSVRRHRSARPPGVLPYRGSPIRREHQAFASPRIWSSQRWRVHRRAFLRPRVNTCHLTGCGGRARSCAADIPVRPQRTIVRRTGRICHEATAHDHAFPCWRKPRRRPGRGRSHPASRRVRRTGCAAATREARRPIKV